MQIQKVIRLQQHVAEFGEGNTVFPLKTHLDRVLADHIIYREMLADISQEIHQIQ